MASNVALTKAAITNVHFMSSQQGQDLLREVSKAVDSLDELAVQVRDRAKVLKCVKCTFFCCAAGVGLVGAAAATVASGGVLLLVEVPAALLGLELVACAGVGGAAELCTAGGIIMCAEFETCCACMACAGGGCNFFCSIGHSVCNELASRRAAELVQNLSKDERMQNWLAGLNDLRLAQAPRSHDLTPAPGMENAEGSSAMVGAMVEAYKILDETNRNWVKMNNNFTMASGMMLDDASENFISEAAKAHMHQLTRILVENGVDRSKATEFTNELLMQSVGLGGAITDVFEFFGGSTAFLLGISRAITSLKTWGDSKDADNLEAQADKLVMTLKTMLANSWGTPAYEEVTKKVTNRTQNLDLMTVVVHECYLAEPSLGCVGNMIARLCGGLKEDPKTYFSITSGWRRVKSEAQEVPSRKTTRVNSKIVFRKPRGDKVNLTITAHGEVEGSCFRCLYPESARGIRRNIQARTRKKGGDGSCFSWLFAPRTNSIVIGDRNPQKISEGDLSLTITVLAS